MTFKKILQEEFKDWVKVSYGPTAPIYVNPTSDELKDCTKFDNQESVIGLKGSIKFIVDVPKKRVIVFPGYIIHATAWKQIEGSRDFVGAIYASRARPDLFCGEGRYDNGKIRFVESDTLQRNPDIVKEMLKLKWDFGDKYFTEPVKTVIEKFKPNNAKAEFEYKLEKLKTSVRNRK